RVLDQMPRIVGHLHLDDDVAGEELALDLAPLPPLHLDQRLCRDSNVAERVGHPHRLDSLAQVLPNPLLEAGVRVDDVPVPRLRLGFSRHVTTPAERKTLSRSQESPASTTKR